MRSSSLVGCASTNGQPIAAGSLSPSQSMVALACRDHVEIFSLNGKSGEISKHENINLTRDHDNFTVTDVSWSPFEEDLVAGSATNGQIAVLRVSQHDADEGSRKSHISLKWQALEDSKRTVNRVSWHPNNRTMC